MTIALRYLHFSCLINIHTHMHAHTHKHILPDNPKLK